MRIAIVLPLLLGLTLGACGGTGASTSGSGKAATIRPVSQPVRTAIPRTQPPQRPAPPRPVPQVQMIPGLEGVIGADADQLGRVFGSPRIDVHEDDARKLQWSGTACILDVYLYPPANGGRATATYVDARRGDGRDVDRAACVAALRKGRPPAP